MKNETCAAPDPVVAAEGFLESLTKPEKGCRFFHCYRTGMMRVAAKARSGVAFGLYVFLDTSRFGYRLTLLSRTLLPVPAVVRLNRPSAPAYTRGGQREIHNKAKFNEASE